MEMGIAGLPRDVLGRRVDANVIATLRRGTVNLDLFDRGKSGMQWGLWSGEAVERTESGNRIPFCARPPINSHVPEMVAETPALRTQDL